MSTEQTKDSIRERYGRQRDLSKVTVIPAKKEMNPFDASVTKRVVVYCRVSTDGISQTTSFELQKNYYLKYVRRRPDWRLVGMYSDEGLTATKIDKRVGLLTMLDDAKAGKFDLIIVKNLSRLNRNLRDCMQIVNDLRNLPHPVGILFETEGLFTLAKNIDFTLTVLSLVAEEESHKKAEAMNSSYYMRFSQGDYVVPDLLGYRKTGINEIEVDEEEAKTVKLIFDMYLAGIKPDTIAEVLVMLGRKKHIHFSKKDSKFIGGGTEWTASSVRNIIKNERRAGDVLAQKTYTPDYRTHKAVRNNGNRPQFYARDQHEAIIPREDYLLATRIMDANKGGWKNGLQQMKVYESGALQGFVSAAPSWRGFDAEDYNRAGLRASGMSEAELDAIEDRIVAKLEEEAKKNTMGGEEGIQHHLTIDSDNYEMFPDVDMDSVEEKEPEIESYKSWLEKSISTTAPARSGYDFSSCTVVRPELFTNRDKPHVTIDFKGMYFNRMCNEKLTDSAETTIIENVDVFYNPVEKLVVVKSATAASAATMRWASQKDENVNMRRCSAYSLSDAIYINMGWIPDFKYRVIASVMPIDGEPALVFPLQDAVPIVPAKAGTIQNIDTQHMSEDDAKQMMKNGIFPENEVVPDLDDFNLGNGPIASAAKTMARSRAIYYDETTEKTAGELHVEDLGEKKYDPHVIQSLIQRGLTPKEGWCYLKGVAVIRKSSFTIFPESWIGSIGDNYYESTGRKMRERFGGNGKIEEGIDYGWTVGLKLPTQADIDAEIQSLMADA